MDTLKGILSDIRVFMVGGVATLPLTIAGTLLIIGLFTANYAMLFFLVGFMIIAPLSASFINIFAGFTGLEGLKRQTANCGVVLSLTSESSGPATEYVLCSQWLTMAAFFVSYLFMNGWSLYNAPALNPGVTINSTKPGSDVPIDPNNPSDTSKLQKRTTQAEIAMISIVIFGIILVCIRYKGGCELPLFPFELSMNWVIALVSLVATLALGGSLGYSWYKLLSVVGENRLSDLFGIANRLLPPSAIINRPVACVPVPA